MRIKDAIHGSELHVFLAQDLKQRALAPPSPSGPLALAQHKPLSTAKAKEWLHTAQQTADEVGRMPPEPPTLRARVGAVFVQLVRRMVFWLTPQINSANQAMLGVIQEQISLIDHLAVKVVDLQAQMSEIAAGQRQASEQLDSAIVRTTGQILEHTEQLLAHNEQFRAHDGQFSSHNERLAGYNQQLVSFSEQLAGFTSSSDAVRELLQKQILQLRSLQFVNERRIAEMAAGRDKQLDSIPVSTQAQARADENDSLYLLLEDRFRGTREEIKSRLIKYLPYLQAAGAGTSDAPVLDLGCGRCEWLRLLRENHLQAAGVDLNRVFVTEGLELGLDVTFGDAVAALRQRPDNSLGCVTGFHIVEHLPWSTLTQMVDEVVRVLKPGGVAVFETPNPENVQVGSNNFYFDPTHRNPIPSLLLKFLLDARGLYNVEIVTSGPYPKSMRLHDDGQTITRRFNDLFYGPQDYAAIARKP